MGRKGSKGHHDEKEQNRKESCKTAGRVPDWGGEKARSEPGHHVFYGCFGAGRGKQKGGGNKWEGPLRDKITM